MANLRIATWNIKNSYLRLDKNKTKLEGITGLLEVYEPDFLALQEVNPMLATKIDKGLKEIGSEYRITTDYEKSKNLIKNLKIEFNIIISKLGKKSESYLNQLYSEPTRFKLLDFVKPCTKFETNQLFENNLLLSTTNLDLEDELRKKQLREILSILKVGSINYDTIFMGTLNSQPIEPHMIEFTEKLNDIGMKIVENPHKTYKYDYYKQPIDYIIVPNSWEIEEVKTLNTDIEISSHNPVIVDVKRR